MKEHFFNSWFLGMLYFFSGLAGTVIAQNYRQDFESDFLIANNPDAFLPNWFGNDVRSTNSRVFQLNEEGIGGGRALAVQPISSFDGEIIVSLSLQNHENPKLIFWAKALRNGTGTRPAQVFYSWGESLEGDFTEAVLLGKEDEFANEDQEFREFELMVPDLFQDLSNILFRIEIRYGPGSGSCARWVMDDFVFGVFEEDLTSPQVSMVRGFDDREVEISFSEAVDPVFSQIQLSYRLGEIETQEAVLISDSLVILRFEESLENGKEYSVQISQIPDLEGNFLTDTTVNFRFFDPTLIPSKGIVINELMPAPRGENELPDVEYLELYHAGEYAFRLENLILSNSRSSTLLEEFWINPGEYLILTPANQGDMLRDYGQVLSVNSWPTLLNSGDEVSLKDDQGNVIDRLSYSTATWGGSEFSGGGYSLEVSNPFFACDQSGLLKASVDPAKGTPGRQNSIFDITPDQRSPELLSVRFLLENSVVLTFSEPISPDLTADNFSSSVSLEVDSVSVLQRQVQLIFNGVFPENKVVFLEIRGLQDCSGNLFGQNVPVELIRPVLAQQGDVVINELLFNPKSGGPKFVELYNRTENYLEIGGWSLANRDVMGDVAQVRKLSGDGLILKPGQYLAISTDVARLQMDYPKSILGSFYQISSLPSYPIAGGTVVLLDSGAEISEMFTYSEDLHHPLLRDPKGVSLERVSIETSVDIPSNWHSASGVEEYATPGRKNSQLIPGEFEGELIQIDPEIFDPEGSNGNTFVAIRFQLGQNGWLGSFRIFDLGGRLVQALAQNEILGSEGFFTWTGTDGAGKKVRPGYYVLLVELYNLDGELRTIKKTIVVAERL